ncbi:major facilitator superfamily domain-containing protein 6 [Caerostris extrusa]|uniref:Major facilitator superfamily domain-containing protein 6 n=1 Tax=Caerostris extrusa TaxID=172846 RepID=A0AAV4RGB6_CAEEX|nr:major facilitator superfamily domain-containing protein 6 [Caerostris extrusa]
MASDKNEKSREADASESTEKLVEKKSFWRVDKEMLRFKIHFFLYNGGLAPVVPFTIVFAKERLGLSASSLGAVLTAQMVMFIFTKPSIGYIADYFNRLKTIICVLTIGNIADLHQRHLHFPTQLAAKLYRKLVVFSADSECGFHRLGNSWSCRWRAERLHTGDFIASWTVFAVAMILFLLNIASIDLVKPHFSQNILRDVGTVLKSKEFLIFEAVIFMNGVGTGIIWFYLVWFLRSIEEASFSVVLLSLYKVSGAIPLMFFFGYLTNPWWILPVEIGHGLTYGLYYTVLASYGKLSAKPGTEATTQPSFSAHMKV